MWETCHLSSIKTTANTQRDLIGVRKVNTLARATGAPGRDGRDGMKGDPGVISPSGLQGPPGPFNGGLVYTRWGDGNE